MLVILCSRGCGKQRVNSYNSHWSSVCWWSCAAEGAPPAGQAAPPAPRGGSLGTCSSPGSVFWSPSSCPQSPETQASFTQLLNITSGSIAVQHQKWLPSLKKSIQKSDLTFDEDFKYWWIKNWMDEVFYIYIFFRLKSRRKTKTKNKQVINCWGIIFRSGRLNQVNLIGMGGGGGGGGRGKS